jgi:type I restriction-modification system DNA methylase subunit
MGGVLEQRPAKIREYQKGVVMLKLTKAQQKDRDRIEAWLKQEPFRENSRSKPEVPDLSIEEVIETYVPPDIQGAGQFFTPLIMAKAAHGYLPYYSGQPVRILEPCAGIGNLLYPFLGENANIQIDAFELERECVEIGKKLYPFANWTHACTHDHLGELEGKYDFVLMNPPFNTKRGMYEAEENSEAGLKNSAHLFLELAIKALKPGGRLVAIAPYNYLEKLPKKGRAWFDDRAVEEFNFELPGEFRFTGMRVNLFCIAKNEEASEPEQIHEPVARPVAQQQLQLSLF